MKQMTGAAAREDCAQPPCTARRHTGNRGRPEAPVRAKRTQDTGMKKEKTVYGAKA